MNAKNKKPGAIKSKILEWLGVPVGLTDSEFWKAFNATANAAGQSITTDSVMSLSAAWACTRLIAETASTLPLHLYERTPDGRKRAVNHPYYSLLHSSPRAGVTATTYWESKIAAMLLRGNGLSEKKRINGRLVALNFLSPNRIHPATRNGKQVLQYTELDGSARYIDYVDIFHIAGFSLDGKWGLSTIQYGAAVFGNALAASTAANKTFENGMQPTTAFTLKDVLKKEQRTDFRESLEEMRGALNAGKSPLLEGGMGIETVGLAPKDVQLLESRTFSVEEVCRWFRVDPSMVGHGGKDSNFGTGLEQKLIGFLTFTLRPWLTRIEQAINISLLSPADQRRYYAEFSIEGLLRADSAARAAFYGAMVDHGIFTRDEVRVLENMKPMGGNAAVLTVQSAMAPLDSIGQQTQNKYDALASYLENQKTGTEG